MMELDAAFEQKNEIARAVDEELEKVYPFILCFKLRFWSRTFIICLLLLPTRLCQLMGMK